MEVAVALLSIDRYEIPHSGFYRVVGGGTYVAPLSFGMVDGVPYVFLSQRGEASLEPASEWDPSIEDGSHYLRVITADQDVEGYRDWSYIGSVDLEVDGSIFMLRAYWRVYDVRG